MDIFNHLEQQNIRLTDGQKQAVLANGPAVLLLAVPGAGKTTTLAARVAHLMATGRCAPGQMLNLTFNREAAADMQRRFTRLFGGLWPPEASPRFSTIHSFCYRLLGDYAARRGTAVPQLMDEGRQRRLVLESYREKTGEYITEDTMDRILNAIGLCANMMYDDAECRRLEREVRGLSEVRAVYRNYKLEHRLMDFDDMLSYTLEVLRRQPSRAEALRRRYPYLHLDEAQDTSLLQHTILETLAPGHVFFVGDEDQSIYGFRGAFPEALLEFRQRHPGGVVLKMEENFRSSAEIVRDAGRFIAGNCRRYEKTMRPARGEGGAVRTLSAGAADRQYALVAQELERLPQGRTAAVLYRGGLTAAGMADLLMRKNIPFALRAKRYPLMQDSVVQDVLAMMRMAMDPSDSRAFLQVYYKLGSYISRDTAQRAVGQQPADLWQYLIEEEDFPGKSTARLSFLRAFFHRMRSWKPQRAIQHIIQDLEYMDGIQKRGESGYGDEAAAHKLAVLYSIAGGCQTLAEFADRLCGLDRLMDEAADPTASVTLSTVHSAKGREFDRVWLVDLFEGVFPGGQAVEENLTGSDRLMEEEARVFYVAVTRAREQLTLCTADEFCGYELLASRFVPRLNRQPGQRDGGQELLQMGVRRGTRLAHKSFGIGSVVDINNARGMFSVRFAKWGVKTFSAESLQADGIFRVL